MMSFNVDGLNHCELSHRIVRETECTSCGALPWRRCRTRSTPENPMGRVLIPSESHRPRVEAWHRANPITLARSDNLS